MKRGRHDSDYDRVRREAGLAARQRSEFPEENEQRDLQKRIEAGMADFRKRMADLDQHDAERVAELAERTVARSKEIGRRILLREYERAGIPRPEGMLVSLSLLLKLGWRIEEIEGKRTLVKPVEQKRRKSREDYERERAENAEGS